MAGLITKYINSLTHTCPAPPRPDNNNNNNNETPTITKNKVVEKRTSEPSKWRRRQRNRLFTASAAPPASASSSVIYPIYPASYFIILIASCLFASKTFQEGATISRSINAGRERNREEYLLLDDAADIGTIL